MRLSRFVINAECALVFMDSNTNDSQRLLEETQSDQPVSTETKHAAQPTRRVLADGTYASESAFSSKANDKAKLDAVKSAHKPPLRGNRLQSCML